MTRNLKALGLALMAAFAMSAVLSSAAQAEAGTIEADVGAENAFLTGTTTSQHKFQGNLGTVECGETVFDGTIKTGDHVLTITPTYKKCTTNIFGTKYTTTVFMTGCDYKFTEGNATSVEDKHHFNGITTSLICPNPGEAVHIVVYNSTTPGVGHEVGNRRCEFTVTPFSHKLNTTAVNNTAGAVKDVDVVTNVPDVPVKRTFGGLFQCGSENSASDYTGTTTLRAYKDAAHTEQTDLTMTDVG